MSTASFRTFAIFIFFMIAVLLPVNYLLSDAGAVQINQTALQLFAPLPALMNTAENPVTDVKVNLGRMLYYDPRLSADQKISCNTCHPLDLYGAEPKKVSTGFKAQKGSRNAPTVYNAAGHFVQFWDGRVPTVEQQAKGPILNPVEMAIPSEAAAVKVLKSMPEYVVFFKEAFPGDQDPVTYDNMARAIGAFERGLVTPAPWDRFLEGDPSALSNAQKAGFNTFVEAGCATCHRGAYVGGETFQKLGILKPWPDQSDPGRAAVTKHEEDKMVFKVPSLRNIQQTGPYFHNGSVPTLEQAIRNMAVHQSGARLSDAQVKSIESWFTSLTGEIPKRYIAAPELPKRTSQTPAPLGG